MASAGCSIRVLSEDVHGDVLINRNVKGAEADNAGADVAANIHTAAEQIGRKRERVIQWGRIVRRDLHDIKGWLQRLAKKTNRPRNQRLLRSADDSNRTSAT